MTLGRLKNGLRIERTLCISRIRITKRQSEAIRETTCDVRGFCPTEKTLLNIAPSPSFLFMALASFYGPFMALEVQKFSQHIKVFKRQLS